MAEKYFTIGEFVDIARTTKPVLMNYEKVGLLSPIRQEGNNYRSFTVGDLSVVNAIRGMQNLGLTLDDIKSMIDQRNPEQMEELITKRITEIDAAVGDYMRVRELLSTIREALRAGMNIDEDAMTVEYRHAEAIVLGSLNIYGEGEDDYDALYKFYRDMRKQYPGLDLNYPVWGVFSQEWVKKGNLNWPERYYFYNPAGTDKRPEGEYAIGYTRGGYGQIESLFRRTLEYAEGQGFEMSGNAYAEYLHNEMSVADDTNYLIRLMIAVRKKDGV